jgi:hypothetical protein
MPVETEAASEPRTRRLSRGHWLATGVALLLVVATGAAVWTWRHPDVSFEYGYGMTMTRDVGFTVWTTLGDSDRPGDSPITFTDLEPRFRQDGAGVQVEYLICDLDPVALEEHGVGGFGYGGPTRWVERYCASTRPADGGDLVLRTDTRQELLVGITATRPGRTVITGHHVTYRVGWQRGSSEIAVSTRLTARRPA